jgi:hypothetical protein
MKRYFTTILVALVIGLAGAGCLSEPCDAGQTYRQGLCYPGVDAQPAEGADAGPDAAAGGGSDAAADPFAHYGDPCAELGECAAPTDFCAVRPGQSIGFCTHTGCVEDSSVCPATWTCLDLSAFGQPSFCNPP